MCPKCMKEISVMINFKSGEKRFIFDGYEYHEEDFVTNGKTDDFECPECQETLFTCEKDAKNFLGNKNKNRG